VDLELISSILYCLPSQEVYLSLLINSPRWKGLACFLKSFAKRQVEGILVDCWWCPVGIAFSASKFLGWSSGIVEIVKFQVTTGQ
jgi:hypothetical protein